jgi:hypothetical protein
VVDEHSSLFYPTISDEGIKSLIKLLPRVIRKSGVGVLKTFFFVIDASEK